MSGTSKKFTVGVIGGFKISDAAICAFLERAGLTVRVIRYRVPVSTWASWITKRIREMGFIVFAGHILLSLFLRMQRIYEKLFGTSLWLAYSKTIPSWSTIHGEKKDCFSEHQVIEFLKGVDLVLMLDHTRLSHDFYRSQGVPVLQIVWSNDLKYLGDSPAFWAYSVGDHAAMGVSVIQRKAAFNKFTLLGSANIRIESIEDLRTIKIKQVLALQHMVPAIISKALHSSKTHYKFKRVSSCVFRAPTFFTYLHYLKRRRLKDIPSYAFKVVECNVSDPRT